MNILAGQRVSYVLNLQVPILLFYLFPHWHIALLNGNIKNTTLNSSFCFKALATVKMLSMV